LNGTIRADHDTHPTSNALLSVMKDNTRLLILIKGSAHAGFYTIRLFTMTALETEGERSFLLHKDARKGLWVLLLKGLENIFRFRMFNQAMDFAQATSNTDLFFNVDSFHF
jgi:hypothetical protein